MNEKKRRPRVASASRLVGRVIGYMLHYYKYLFLLVIACILINAVATVVGATFPQKLVDNYIMPMLNTGSDDFSNLARDLFQLAGIMAIGVVAAFTYNRIMVNVSQGTMLHLRDDLFARMEALPIKYFDTHAHGDIMSVYTNDVDTLRQLLSQSIPQIINSLISMTATLVTMLILNPALTVISILTAVVMLLVTSNFSKLSGKYFIKNFILRPAYMLPRYKRYGAIGTMTVAAFAYLYVSVMMRRSQRPLTVARRHFGLAQVSKQLLIVEFTVILVNLRNLLFKFGLVSLRKASHNEEFP